MPGGCLGTARGMSSDANARDGADRKPNGGSAERGKGDGKQRDAKFYDARKERQAGQESATHPKAAASAGGGAAEDGWSSVSRSRAEPKATKQPEGGAGRGGAKSGARGGGAIGAAWAGRGGNVEAGAAPPRKEGPDSEKPANKTRPATAPPGRGRGDATRDSGQGRVGDAGGRGRGRGGPSSGADAPAGDGHFARTEWLALSPGWFPLCNPGFRVFAQDFAFLRVSNNFHSRQGGRGTLAGEDGGVGDPPPARTPLEVGGGDAEAGRAWGPGGWGGGARRRQREERSPGEGRTRPRLT